MAEREAQVLESSENLSLETVFTVRSDRGDEYIVNADALAKTVANIVSEEAHEIKMGWSLQDGFYRDAYRKIVRQLLRSKL